MSEQTKIAWCDSTVNFWSGCTKVSPGCANCYAEALSKRGLGTPGRGGTFGKWGPGAPRRLHESAFKLAHRLNRKPWVCDRCGVSSTVDDSHCDACHTDLGGFHRRRIFSLSLGDWLDPEVPVEWLARMLDTIRTCPDVIWMLLTKRPQSFFSRLADASIYRTVGGRPLCDPDWVNAWACRNSPPNNIAVGTSVEDQQRDHRISDLIHIPARWRFLSLEPLLGPVALPKLDGIHQLIIGGESGPKSRTCNVEWMRSLVRQGRSAGVPVFVKQLGARPVFRMPPDNAEPMGEITCLDPKGGDPSEWPEDLRVREQPDWEATR